MAHASPQYLAFVRLVYDMRSAQKRYFATRNNDSLVRSKLLEKEVDIQILTLLTPVQQRADQEPS